MIIDIYKQNDEDLRCRSYRVKVADREGNLTTKKVAEEMLIDCLNMYLKGFSSNDN